MTDSVMIPVEPSAADLNRLAKIATETVQQIARLDGALGHDAITLLYVQRLYAGVVAGLIKSKKQV